MKVDGLQNNPGYHINNIYRQGEDIGGLHISRGANKHQASSGKLV